MRFFSLATMVACTLVAFSAAAVEVPTGFTSELVVGGFNLPTVVTPAPDGRLFVAEKVGKLWLLKDGVKPAKPILDISAQVNKEADRGLLGVALHPDFAQNGYIYLLYVYDDVAGSYHQANDEAVLQRLDRYTVKDDAIDPASLKILFGATAADSPTMCFSSHAIGTVRFGLDRSLIVSVGDGAHWDFIDGGQDVSANDPTCRAVYGAAEDIGALRALTVDSLAGKILRLDPETGLGLPSNPYYDGNPASHRSKVWASGFKNPFRFGIRANTAGPGSLFIGDVGTDLYEEIDLAHGGENFGFPCFEGPDPMPGYQSDPHTAPTCAQWPASKVTMPFWSSAHNHENRATGGVIEYRGGSYPARYKGAFFVADYALSTIKALHVDAAERLSSVEDFATGADNPVDLELDPQTGDILYVSISTGEVRRLRYSLENQPPVAKASATPLGGPPPLSVTFSSDGSTDPEGDPLTFDWDFGDGSPHASLANPTHVYAANGAFTATLTVTDDHGHAATATVDIQSGNAPPTVRFVTPQDGETFNDGDQVPLLADAHDPNGDALSWKWNVELIHAGHVHYDVFTSDQAQPPPFVARDHGALGERFSYLVTVRVTDAGGLFAESRVHLIPVGLSNAPPVAAMTASPGAGPAPLTVAFDASPSTDPDGDLLDASWSFGDGASATGTRVTHTFDHPGAFTVTLTVSDIFGATATATKEILVGEVTKNPGAQTPGAELCRDHPDDPQCEPQGCGCASGPAAWSVAGAVLVLVRRRKRG